MQSTCHGLDMPERLPMDLEEAEAWPAKVWNLQPLPGSQGLAQEMQGCKR